MKTKQLKPFKVLTARQKAVDLTILIYKITEKFLRFELYELAHQMRRSIVLISSNIIRDFKKSHRKNKLQVYFYNIVYGSTAALENQIEITRKLNFLISENHHKFTNAVTEISKMIDGLIKSVNKYAKPYLLNSAMFLIFLYSIFYILYPISIKAAELKLNSSISEIGINQQFQVDLLLDTENEEINAVEGKVIFPEDLLELKEIKDNAAIVNLWIERPTAKTGNQIIFSGVIPGGYVGEKGLLFSALFQAKQKGKNVIKIYEAKTLLNDGQGTLSPLSIANFHFFISEQTPILQIPKIEIKDTDIPEFFTPLISQNPEIFNGKYFLVFLTQDKGSGIDHYEILEKEQKNSIRSLVKKEKWQIGDSPYLLKDQRLKSYIFVKAVDKAGNERIVRLSPQNSLRWYENLYIWIIIIIVYVIIFWRKLKVENEKSKNKI